MTIKLLPALALISTVLIATPSFAAGKKAVNQNSNATSASEQTRDAASGLPSGKRAHRVLNSNKPVDKSSPLVPKLQNGLSTKAHGLPTGKRRHKPVTISKELDKASPQMGKTGYRLCPDGTMINPGEKCPEKASRAIQRK